MRAVWKSYVKESDLALAEQETLLSRCMSYAGARTIQTVYEHMSNSLKLSPAAASLARFGLSILKDPQSAFWVFLQAESNGS
jgi:hypothetical protein